MIEKKLYTIQETAKVLGVSASKINRLSQQCMLDRIDLNKEGGRPTYRITKTSVDKLIENKDLYI